MTVKKVALPPDVASKDAWHKALLATLASVRKAITAGVISAGTAVGTAINTNSSVEATVSAGVAGFFLGLATVYAVGNKDKKP